MSAAFFDSAARTAANQDGVARGREMGCIAVLLCSRISKFFSYSYATLKPQMRQTPLCLLCIGAAVACLGQVAAPEEPAIKRLELAQKDLARITELVQADALPRLRLEQARQDVADAEDGVTLARTLSAPMPAVDEITDQMMNDMVAAAQRRVDRQQARIDQSKVLIDKGFLAGTQIVALLQELSNRQATLDLANSQARLMTQTVALAKLERSIAEMQSAAAAGNVAGADALMEHYEGAGKFNEARDLRPLARAFALEFDHALPISADGETGLHRALGFDHRGRVDVAVRPNDPEGVWLRQYLQAHHIPYYAFSQAVPGKATAAHIHIGPGSTRLNGD